MFRCTYVRSKICCSQYEQIRRETEPALKTKVPVTVMTSKKKPDNRSSNPKQVHYSFKASQKESEIIQKKMKLFGISNRSAFIRTMVLNGYLLKLDLPELSMALRQIGTISSNINQVVRMMHERGSIYDTEVDEIVEQQKEIREILTQIMRRLDGMSK